MFPYVIRAIKPDEYIMVRDAISQNFFLEKRSWSQPLSEMAFNGLKQNKWNGFACFDESKKLISYCDYKIHRSGEVEVGICFTMQSYRGQGLAKMMLHILLTCFSNQEITIGTSENNISMIACIKKMGFLEEYRIPNDRVNGDASIHYRRIP